MQTSPREAAKWKQAAASGLESVVLDMTNVRDERAALSDETTAALVAATR